MKKRNQQLVKSERPEVNVDRDLAEYRAGLRRKSTYRRLCGFAGIVFGVVLIVCYCAGCFDGVFAFLLPPVLVGTEQESGTENPATDPSTTEAETEPESNILTAAELYRFDTEAVPAGEIPVRPMDLSMSAMGNAYIVNETGHDPLPLDADAMKAVLSLSQSQKQDEPLVLILHTHTTEAYLPAGSTSCVMTGNFARSDNSENNMIAVGNVLTEALTSRGIGVIHCQTVFDSPSCRGAYDRAAETITFFLNTYPSIRYVIDVHRDCVTDSSGNLIRTVTPVDGEAVAQVMCVVGTDENGTACPWMSNFTFAQQLRSALNESYDAFCRPTVVRSSSFNQEYGTVSLLLEIGTAGNSVEEAKQSASLLGEILSGLILPEN